MKIKAGALQYVLVISVIIAIIIFAFISLIYLQQRMTVKHGFTKQVIANTQLGFDYLKTHPIPYNTPTTLNLFENESAVTNITKKHWGIFDVAIIQSNIKNETFQKIGLLGTENSKKDALYLQENNTSLVLVGNTKIIGNVSLPKQGVKSGNIAGTSYYGNELIYGNTKTSSTSLPKIKNLAFLKDFYTNFYETNSENFELEDGLKIHQSFSENTLLYEDVNQISLINMSLSGNILIVSKSAIKVFASAQLEDVILMAPKIIIESNVRGNFQAIASKTIEIKDNCLLTYPTALILLEKKTASLQTEQGNNQQIKEENKIHISKNSQVKGMVLFHSDEKAVNYNPQIKIEEKGIVIGEVYCTKNLEILGSVFGTVYTNNFIAKQFGSTYMNHIYNGSINSKKLPSQYAGFNIGTTFNSVAKWVD